MSGKKLDILLMGDNNLDTVGGEQESTKIIINGIKDKYSLGVIQPGRINKPKSDVIYFDLTKQTRIKHLVKTPLAFIRYILDVKNIINTHKPTIIHTQAQVSFFIVALLKKFRLISKNIYLIHTERGFFTKYSRVFKYIFYYFMKDLNMLVTTTKLNMKHWRESLEEKGLHLNYTIIENTAGEIFEKFDQTLENKDEERIVIGFAGRYTEWKNWPLAVEISENLNNVIGNKLWVKMTVGCLDEKSLESTKQMFEKLYEIFGDRFIGKINVDIEEMDKFYYDVDVFILTSNKNTESFGRTLVEAMSRKTIVLTTDAGGSVEVVDNKENVCSSSDEFVSRILEFYNNPQKMYNEKKQNLIRTKQKYSLENNIKKHLTLYKKIKKDSLEVE
ncbi:glycosyltransferase family 4 protein [Carnobacterium funditum]|uniref:glycosyltransferase family 4 protein n=1 Tax=Carnobacterium funditum TaxID=2752 RepID=UPI00055477C6|nr:glycosyltransferase family 4 protein [Carnobacterium funditum]